MPIEVIEYFGMGRKMKRVDSSKLVLRRKITSLFIVGALSLTFVLFQNCSQHDSSSQADASSQAFSQTNAKAIQILGTKCSSCHEGVTDVTQLESLGWLVVGEPSGSSLYLDTLDKVEPRDKNYLTEDEVVVLRDWIAQMGDNWNTVINPPETDGSGNPIIPGTYNYVVAFGLTKCMGCHSAANAAAAGGGVNLANFNTARTRVNDILREMRDGTMPPQGAPATPFEIMVVQEWVDNGLPQQ